MKRVTICSAPWNWVIALAVLQVTDLVSTRMAVANSTLIEGNPLLTPIVTTWWFLFVKIVIVTGVGIWLVLRAPKVLQVATLIYLGIVLSNIILVIRSI